MPDTFTVHYNFTKPDVGGDGNVWGDRLNTSLDAIDTTIYSLSLLVAAKLDSAAYTAGDVLTKIKTVDGAGSGLDADTVDGIDSGSLSGSMSSSAILTSIKTVDGAGSGLDADLLDGNHAAAFSLTGHTHTTYVLKAGDTVTGNIIRQSAGPHLYHVTAAYTSGRLFVTAAGAADPTSLPGDIWIETA